MCERLRSGLGGRWSYALLVLILSGCGGGGGGGGGSNPPPPPVERTPDQIYTGSRTPAEISEGSHQVIADNAWGGPITAFVLAQDVITADLADGPVDETVNGSGGGNAHVHGTISGGTGALTVDYSNYTEDGLTLQGSETMTILARRTLQGGSVRRSFHALTLSSVDLHVTLDGSLTRTDSTTSSFLAAHWDISGDLVLTESASSQKRVAALSLQRTMEQVGPFSSFPMLTGTAQVFDSTLGRIDVSFDVPLVFSVSDPQVDAFAGSLRATGAHDTRLWVSPLSNAYVAVELGPDGASNPTRSIVYRWADAFERSAGATRTESLAIATFRSDLLLQPRAGEPVPLESRFSEGANGEFVTPTWSLVLSPPGSQAQLTNEQTTRPVLMPDMEGGYLLRLQTSDSTGTSTDYYGVYAFAPSGDGPVFAPQVHRVLPPYMKVPTNSLVQLDGSRTHMTDGTSVQNQQWQVFRSTESLPFATGGATVEFTAQPDEEYIAQFMNDGQIVGPIGSQDEVWITSTGNVAFSQAAGFDTQNASGGTTPFLLADIDGNGTIDIIERNAFGGGGTAQMRVLLNKGAGRFAWHPVTFSGGVGSFGGDVAALPADLNGDGRLDIVVPDSSGIGVFTQAQGATLDFTYRLLPRTVDCGPFAASAPISFVLLDVDRDGRKDIVSEAACSALRPLEFYRNDPAAPDGFAPAVAMVTPAASSLPYRLSVGDIDGDGHEDLLGVDTLSGGPISLIIWRNMPNAQFDALSTTAMSATQVTAHAPIAVGDLDGDGKLDLVFSGNTGVEVAFGDGSGTFAFSAPLPALDAGFTFGQQTMLVDLDRDGRLDITAQTTWARQLPGRQFARGRQYPTSIGQAWIADMNGDGRPDLVSWNGPRIAFAIE